MKQTESLRALISEARAAHPAHSTHGEFIQKLANELERALMREMILRAMIDSYEDQLDELSS